MSSMGRCESQGTMRWTSVGQHCTETSSLLVRTLSPVLFSVRCTPKPQTIYPISLIIAEHPDVLTPHIPTLTPTPRSYRINHGYRILGRTLETLVKVRGTTLLPSFHVILRMPSTRVLFPCHAVLIHKCSPCINKGSVCRAWRAEQDARRHEMDLLASLDAEEDGKDSSKKKRQKNKKKERGG